MLQFSFLFYILYVLFLITTLYINPIECGIFRTPLKTNSNSIENLENNKNDEVDSVENENDIVPDIDIDSVEINSNSMNIGFDKYKYGLMATFYNNITIEEFKDNSYHDYEIAIKTPIQHLRFSTEGSFIDTHVYKDYFVMDFVGVLHIETYGTYTFDIHVDDLLDLTIDNKSCVSPSDGGGHVTCELNLNKEINTIKGRYYESIGPAGLNVAWSCSDCKPQEGVSKKKRSIPATSFGYIEFDGFDSNNGNKGHTQEL